MLRAQEAGVKALYQRQLVRGKVYAIAGLGLSNDFRLVALVCVSATRPIIVAWRLVSGPASEKGQEAVVTRSRTRASAARGRAAGHQLEAFRCPLR
jgi:hypothetical protein